MQKELQFGLRYVCKFEKALEYFQLVEVVDSQGQYVHLYRSFAWLLFLLMVREVGRESQMETDYLLISVLYIMIRFGFDYIRPKQAPPAHSNATLITSILNQLFQIFEIDHPAVFKRVTAQTD